MGQFIKDIKGYWKGILLALLTMSVFEYFFHSVCAFRILLGIPCPSCGMTRAFKYLIQGKPAEAFFMHPLYPLVILFGIYFIFCRYLQKCTGKYICIYGIILLVAGIVLYAYRMMYWFPGREPMLYEEVNLLGNILYFIGGL